MKIINLTPHAIHIYKADKLVDTIEPESKPARVQTKAQKILSLFVGDNEVPLMNTEFGEAEDVPSPKDDTYYVVSRLLKQALPDRKDLICPLGDVRDKEGKVIGCTGFTY